ncbi:MAG: AMP-binding protein [bacterium]|nr:AMP-binding protein [Candidatus Sumerlaeota bacterium]
MVRTVGEMFFDSAERYSNRVAQIDTHGSPPLQVTYEQLARSIRDFSSGLISIGLGIGDRVALLSDNRPRWLICDLGIINAGGVNVPRGSDTASAEIWYIINHSGAGLAIVQDIRLLDRIMHAVTGSASLHTIIMMDDSAAKASAPAGVRLLNFSDVLSEGAAKNALHEQRASFITPDHIAAIVYTSGTTGIPRGAMLTHANLTHQSDNIDLGIQVNPGDLLMAVLPSWHVYERAVEYYGIKNGTTFVYTDKRRLRDDLVKMRPQFLPCVPRMWEVIYEAIGHKIEKSEMIARMLAHSFFFIGRHYVAARRVAMGLTATPTAPAIALRVYAWLMIMALWPLYKIGDMLVYAKIRNATGGRLRVAINGGGGLASYLDDFLLMIGVPILNGYGLTEAAPVLTVRRMHHNVCGTVGWPIPGTEIQIRDENGAPVPQGASGVIWARGPQVMAGYYKDEAETRRVISPDGWLCTGDLGWLAYTNDLVITGRAKDTIVLSSGENIEPEPIESVVLRSPLIEQIIVVGQDRKTLGALVVARTAALAERLGLLPDSSARDVIAHPDANKTIRYEIGAVRRANGGCKAFEQITRVTLLEDAFSEANGMMTQTMKPKRNVIFARYADKINKMYE